MQALHYFKLGIDIDSVEFRAGAVYDGLYAVGELDDLNVGVIDGSTLPGAGAWANTSLAPIDCKAANAITSQRPLKPMRVALLKMLKTIGLPFFPHDSLPTANCKAPSRRDLLCAEYGSGAISA